MGAAPVVCPSALQARPALQMALQATFDSALDYVQAGDGPELSQEALLRFYALYKQATEGPCVSEPPSRLNIVAFEKWKAHKALGPLGQEEAMEQYIEEL